MRVTRLGVLVSVGVLFAVTGCDSNSTDTPTPSAPSAANTASAAAGAAPTCVVDSWRASGVNASGATSGASARLTGGAGTTLAIKPDGGTDVDFTPMDPLSFTAQAAGVQVAGTVDYNGVVRGTVQFGTSGDGSGAWTPVGTVNWADLKATVKLTQPINATLLDNASIKDFTGSSATQAGNAVDVQPVLRRGTYTCRGDTLTIETRDDGPTVVWTFTRT